MLGADAYTPPSVGWWWWWQCGGVSGVQVHDHGRYSKRRIKNGEYIPALPGEESETRAKLQNSAEQSVLKSDRMFVGPPGGRRVYSISSRSSGPVFERRLHCSSLWGEHWAREGGGGREGNVRCPVEFVVCHIDYCCLGEGGWVGRTRRGCQRHARAFLRAVAVPSKTGGL